MLSVGLTGNIATGKSTVLSLFADWGATVIDADALVREVQAPGSSVLAAIGARFGGEMIRPDGTLDRVALRRAVAGRGDALIHELDLINRDYGGVGMDSAHHVRGAGNGLGVEGRAVVGQDGRRVTVAIVEP